MVIERQGHAARVHFLDSSGLWSLVGMIFGKKNPQLLQHRHPLLLVVFTPSLEVRLAPL